MTSWAEHAGGRLQSAGYRRGGSRAAVIELLSGKRCAMSPLEIESELRDSGNRVSRASVYRALDQLEALELIRRVEVTRESTSFEPVDPAGHHHHHFVCNRCGRVIPFEDADLESAISRVEAGSDFEVAEHEVTIRGRCPRC